MQAGFLRHVVTLQTWALTKESDGGRIETLVSERQVRANVRFKNGKEAMESGFERLNVTASVRIRVGIDVNEAMKVVFSGRLYDIKAVLPSSDGSFVDLAVEYHTPD